MTTKKRHEREAQISRQINNAKNTIDAAEKLMRRGINLLNGDDWYTLGRLVDRCEEMRNRHIRNTKKVLEKQQIKGEGTK